MYFVKDPRCNTFFLRKFYKVLKRNITKIDHITSFAGQENPLTIPVDGVIPILVTKVVNPTQFYFKRFLNGQNIKQGDIVLARYMLDGLFYHAEVSKVQDSRVQVTYVDYGNTEWIDVSCNMYLATDYIGCLVGVTPKHSKQWSQKALKIFSDAVLHKEGVYGHVLSEST